MATLGELNILLNIKGLGSVKSGLSNLKEEVGKTSQAIDKATNSFKQQEKALKLQEKEFKAFTSNLRQTGRNLTQLASFLRNTGLAITGSFTAAFISAKETVPQVNDELINIQNSFRHMSEDIARATLPTLKEFSKLIEDSSKAVSKLAKENPVLLNTFLKFGGAVLVISALIGTIGVLTKAIFGLISLMKQLQIVSAVGGLTTFGGNLLFIASAIATVIAGFNLLEKGIGSAEEQAKRSKEHLEKIRQSPDVKQFLNRQAESAKSFNQKGGRQVDESGNPKKENLIQPIIQAKQLTKEFLANDIVAVTAALENVKQQSIIAIENSLLMANSVRTQIGGVFSSLSDGIGEAVAQSIVFGQNFLDSMVNVLKNLAAEIIAMLVSVIAKIAILRALGVVGPIPATALFGGGQGFGEALGGTKAGKGISGFFGNVGKLFGFAEGGIVTKPTLGVFGEAGPEAVVPLDKMDQMGGNITINMTEPVFLNDEISKDRFIRKMTDALKRVTNRRTGGTTLTV